MTHPLYQCRSTPHGFAILKDADEPASYQVTEVGPRTISCDCPAGAAGKPTCRHRKMLRYFIDAGHIDDGWQLDWDTRQWHRPPPGIMQEFLPEGVTAVPLDDPSALHNTIADAVGEPHLREAATPDTLRFRRLAE